jgi:hypothetical protein
MRAMLKISELMPMAEDRSCRATRLGVSDRRSGWLKAITTPRKIVSPSSHQMVIVPVITRPASAAPCSIASTWNTRSAVSRSTRSATAPASGAMSMVGNRSAKAMTPSQVGDSVSSQVSQPTAMRCTQVPSWDTRLPMLNRR